MPALAEFLKTTVTDSLTKILQPAGLIPGTLLVGLNLLFVGPVASEHGVPIAKDFTGLSDTWKVVAAAGLIFLVGYLLLSATSAILDTLAGSTWNASLTAIGLSKWREQRRAALEQRIDDGGGLEDVTDLKWRLHTRFPESPAPCTPTSLGDVLRAYDNSVWERFGVRLAALWEPLRATVKADDQAVVAAAGEKTAVDLMTNLTFAGGVFVVESLILFSLWDKPGGVIAAAAGVSLVWLAYRVTVTKVISWCDAIDTVVTLHLDDLLKTIGVRKTSTFADRRSVLEGLSAFLLRGGTAEGVFEANSVAEPTVSGVVGATASITWYGTRDDTASGHYAYVVLVERDHHSATGDVAFTMVDPRFPRLQAPEPQRGAVCDVVRAGRDLGPDALVWRLSWMKPGEGRALSFEVLRWSVTADPDVDVTARRDGKRMEVTVRHDDANARVVTLDLFDGERSEPGHYVPLNTGSLTAQSSDSPQVQRWSLQTPGGDGARVAFVWTPEPVMT